MCTNNLTFSLSSSVVCLVSNVVGDFLLRMKELEQANKLMDIKFKRIIVDLGGWFGTLNDFRNSLPKRPRFENLRINPF